MPRAVPTESPRHIVRQILQATKFCVKLHVGQIDKKVEFTREIHHQHLACLNNRRSHGHQDAACHAMAKSWRRPLVAAHHWRRRRPARHRSTFWRLYPALTELAAIIPHSSGIFLWLGWLRILFIGFRNRRQNSSCHPSQTVPSIVINCSNGFSRVNRSWLLGRLLRDHELEVEENPGAEYAELDATKQRISLRIDIFVVQEGEKPQIDHVWILGWVTIIAQLGISIAPWIRYGDWAIFLITACGTAFAFITGSLRQWGDEKWAGRRLNRPGSTKSKTKTVCLTRGNGHRHAMIIIGKGTTWDFETLATARSESAAETPWLLGGLAVLWACLLIAVSGLKQNTWFLVLIGSIGMVQNIYASAAKRPYGTLNMRLTPYAQRPTIVGLGFDWPYDDENSDEELDDKTQQWKQGTGIRNGSRSSRERSEN